MLDQAMENRGAIRRIWTRRYDVVSDVAEPIEGQPVRSVIAALALLIQYGASAGFEEP